MRFGTRVLVFSFLLAFLLPTTWTLAQTAPAETMPSDPAAILKLAGQVNGISVPDMKPWHLSAKYQTFDVEGKQAGEGTFEMWWAAPDKYKLSLTSDRFTETLYRTSTGTYFTGDTKWPPYPEVLIQQELLSPVPKFQDLSSFKLAKSEVKDGALQLQCLRMTSKQGTPSTMDPMYCFGVDIPALRADSLFDESTIFNRLIRFQGQYIAQDIQHTKKKLPVLHIGVTTLEPIAEGAEIDLAPPKDAVPAPARKIMVSAGVIAGKKIAGYPVDYPENAKMMRIQGVVVLAATIEEDGTVGKLDIISGPKELQKAALDSVKSWRYSPYLLNGEAVKVQTQINIVFSLGH